MLLIFKIFERPRYHGKKLLKLSEHRPFAFVLRIPIETASIFSYAGNYDEKQSMTFWQFVSVAN